MRFLGFSVYKSYISLFKYILKYFIGFDGIVNGIIFLILFSDCLLLVYRNKIDFSVLILFPTITVLLQLCVFRVFCIWDHVTCKKTVLLLPFYSGCFLFLVSLSWLELPVQCWIDVERVYLFVLLLILGRKLSVFHHWVWC